MSALSAAASDEDGDSISALRAENEMLRQSLLAMHNTLEMTAKAGAHHAMAAECLRETVIRWATRAEQAEDMLEAIGAGGVGKLEQHQHESNGDNGLQSKTPTSSATSSSVPKGWKLVPVNITDAMYDAWADDDGEALTAWKALLAAAPQPPTTEQSSVVQPPRQPLTDEQLNCLWRQTLGEPHAPRKSAFDFARAAIAKAGGAA